jgi:hypothetical protein
VLFMVGSACFIVGPFPGYLSWVGFRADAMTFFVGSLFFTSAALLQLIECGIAPRALACHAQHRARRLFAIESRRIDWWACAVQFVGTLFFNVTTFNAFQTDLTTSQAKEMIWTPDWRGSICFLIASELAYIEAGHRLWSWNPRNRAWRIAALNLVGSVAFLVSAIGSYLLPTTGAPLSLFWTNFGTFVGAVCFFVGAYLLLPERTHPQVADEVTAST